MCLSVRTDLSRWLVSTRGLWRGQTTKKVLRKILPISPLRRSFRWVTPKQILLALSISLKLFLSGSLSLILLLYLIQGIFTKDIKVLTING